MRLMLTSLFVCSLIITGCNRGGDKFVTPSATIKVDMSNVVGGGLGNMKPAPTPAKN